MKTASALAEPLAGRRVIMCVGANDTGKSTFVAEALAELAAAGRPRIHIDCDMGQSTIGPPATIGLRTSEGEEFLSFAGNTSPYGVVREIEEGLTRFRRIMDERPGFETLVDTTGLVEGPFGWALKKMKIMLLGVNFVVLLDRGEDTAHIRSGLAGLAIPHMTLCPAPAVRVRPASERTLYRQSLFRAYFENACEVRLSTAGRSVVGAGRPEAGQLTGLVSGDGFLVSLALFVEADRDALIVRAPMPLAGPVTTIRFGICKVSLDLPEDPC